MLCRRECCTANFLNLCPHRSSGWKYAIRLSRDRYDGALGRSVFLWFLHCTTTRLNSSASTPSQRASIFLTARWRAHEHQELMIFPRNHGPSVRGQRRVRHRVPYHMMSGWRITEMSTSFSARVVWGDATGAELSPFASVGQLSQRAVGIVRWLILSTLVTVHGIPYFPSDLRTRHLKSSWESQG